MKGSPILPHLLEIAVCSLIMLVDNPHVLTNADFFGQGNLNLVSDKSEKSQGILFSIICGNPDKTQYEKCNVSVRCINFICTIFNVFYS